MKWYDYKTFNVKEYEFYEKVDNGDMNWIVPGKFMAFSSPYESNVDEEGYKQFTPEDYCKIFKNFGITTVIWLNQKTYEREVSSLILEIS